MSTDQGGGTDSSFPSTDAGVVESVLEAAQVGLVLVGPDSTVEWINERAASYLGLDEAAVVRTDRESFHDSHVRPCLREPDAFPDGRDRERGYDCHVLPADGRRERWLRYGTVPVSTGQFAGGHLEQFTDVTTDQRQDRFQQFRHAAESTDDAVYVVDGGGAIEYANPAGRELVGATTSLHGEPILSVLDGLGPPAAEGIEGLCETLGESGDPAAVERLVTTPAGQRRVRVDCTTMDGGAVITARDITEQRQRERRYETLVENFPNGAVTLVDDELRYQLAGGKLFDELGEEPEDYVGSPVGARHAGDRDVFVESYRAALNGEPTTLETEVSGRTLVLRALPVYDSDGVIRTAIGMSQDVTERVRREEELRWKSRALDEAPVGITITDPEQADNPIIYANQQFCDTTGYGRDTAVGANCRFLQGPGTDPETVSTVRSAIEAEEPVSVELRNYRRDGTRFWNDLNVAPVRDDTGAVVNYVGFQQDVTDRVEREQELAELNQRLDIALEETGTGIWVLEQDDDSVIPYGTTAELFGLTTETHDLDTYLERIVDEDRRVVEESLRTARERRERFDVEFRVNVDGRERWMHSRGIVYSDGSETTPRIVGVVTDITDRKHRVRELEKRQRVLAELHTATREFYPPGSLSDITEFLAEFTENAFDVEYVSVKQFDEERGCLEPAVRAGRHAGTAEAIGTVTPGSSPVWEAYRTGETGLYTGERVADILGRGEGKQLLVTPVGDFGVVVAVTGEDSGFAAVDIDLIEVLTANAESAFQRLRTDRVHTELADELSAKQSRIGELSDIIDSVQAVRRRLAESESQAALESGVCEELLAMADIDFVWLGQPTGEDTDLAPSAWAGDAGGYLDAVLGDGTDRELPAQRAASSHRPFAVENIPNRVFDEPWAKEAVSQEFKSAYSVPLVYDGVLYGVLTAYSRTEAAFGEMYANLVTDVASLLLNYSRILEQRQGGDGQLRTEATFEIDDSTETLQRLAAATDSTIRFDTVAERTDDSLRVLVTLVDGAPAEVCDHAQSMADIDAAERFGDDTHGRLSLRLRPPMLESSVSRHGGRLLAAKFRPDGITARVGIPPNVSHRPIVDVLTSRYERIDLVAKRQTNGMSLPDTEALEDILTERQYEILKSAFYGGYYETPRQVKGQDIAESFGISGPAVYNHLQAAHRTLLEAVFDSRAQTPE